MKRPVRLSVNQALAVAALVLGAVAVFARPVPGPRVTIDPQDLALAAARGADEVPPAALADWIIAGRADYRLLDLRNPSEYATYHIPGAENVPLATLARATIARNEKVVAYSEDGVRAAQAWLLLRARGVRGAYALAGGLERWKRDVLFPALRPGTSGDDQLANDRMRAIAQRFGGRAVSGEANRAAGDAADPAAPARAQLRLPPPPPPVSGSAAPPRVKKKEGC